MRVIPALALTDALVQSSAPEPGPGEEVWLASKAYVMGDEVILTSTHRRYGCVAACTGESPDASLLKAVPKWYDMAATNRWAMFDLLRNTATTHPEVLYTTITPNIRVDALAVLATNATTVRVQMIKNGVIIFDRDKTMLKRQTTTWYEYFFGAWAPLKSLVIFDLPPMINATIIVTQRLAGGTVSCGALVVGRSVKVGATEYNATSDTLNFSSVTRDLFGNATMVQRRNVPKTNQTLFLDKHRVDTVRKLRDDLNALPAVWSGLDDSQDHAYFEALLILGFYRTFTINLDHPTFAKITLELEEV